MPSTVKEKLSHQPIVIKTAGKPVSFGSSGGQKLSFVSVDKPYICFAPALFPDIIPGNTIDADVEVSVSGEYTNNIVTQIYRDGKPLVVKKATGYPPRPSGHTPEERASIENQVRAKIIAELWIGKAIDEKHSLVTMLTNWLGILGELPQATTSPVSDKAVQKATPQPKEAVTATTGAEKQGGEVTHKTVEDLIAIAKEKGIASSLITAIIIREFKKAKASELEPEQRDWLYNQMKEGKMKVEDKKGKK